MKIIDGHQITNQLCLKFLNMMVLATNYDNLHVQQKSEKFRLMNIWEKKCINALKNLLNSFEFINSVMNSSEFNFD